VPLCLHSRRQRTTRQGQLAGVGGPNCLRGDWGWGWNRMLPRALATQLYWLQTPYRAKTAPIARAQLHCLSLLSLILMLMKMCRLRVKYCTLGITTVEDSKPVSFGVKIYYISTHAKGKQ
jgi:hypothetical protein